jgi:hypothetical protein
MMIINRIALMTAVMSCRLGGTASWSEDLFDDPGVSVGVAFALGGPSASDGDVGLTAKVLSNRHENNPVLGAGVTFYPWAEQKLGLDAGVGYNFSHVTPMVGYDFLQRKVQLSTGWSNTKQSKEPSGPQACVQDLDCGGSMVCSSGFCSASP